jgi:hypothetical protein
MSESFLLKYFLSETKKCKSLSPIHTLLLGNNSGNEMMETDTALFLDFCPKLGNEFYGIKLFKGVTAVDISRYERLHNIKIPRFYREILLVVSGAHIYELSLYGISPSMLQNPPLLDRSTSQPFDLGTAVNNWSNEFEGHSNSFHFGGAPFSDDENVGYFYSKESGFYSARNNGQIVNTWKRFDMFLRDEIARTKEMYPAFIEFMAELLIKPKKSKKKAK